MSGANARHLKALNTIKVSNVRRILDEKCIFSLDTIRVCSQIWALSNWWPPALVTAICSLSIGVSLPYIIILCFFTLIQYTFVKINDI